MEQSRRKSLGYRLFKGQHGNVVVYLIGGCILWVVFFAVTGWIKDTKQSRLERYKKDAAQETQYFRGDIYHNPYQKPAK